jgi:hypothetical protein
LKNKAGLGLPPAVVETVRWQVCETVASSWIDGVVWLCRTDTGHVYSLEGVSVDMWRAVACYGNLDAAVEYLLSQYDVNEDRLRDDLSAFADELLTKGLMERVSESCDTTS